MINQIVNNHYHITALLGEGAMGEVYRATDTQTGQDVAIKVITQKLALDEEMLARFRREGEALRHLRHTNIVAFIDMFAVGKQQAIVMEFVPGGSLHSLVKRGPLPVAQAMRIALELSDALAQAHHINIIHRDIKPENVLMAEDGRPKLTDFGVARLLSETHRLTGTGTQMGTPYYMSPEAWEGKQLDEQTDIWSLGVVLFEMVTGKVPFTGDTLVAVMNKVLTTPPPDLKTLRPDVPPALVKIIQRMLTRDKAKRYASMREVALELERAVKGDENRKKETSPRLAEKGGSQPEDRPSATVGGGLSRRAVGIGVAIAGLLVIGGLVVVGGIGLWMVNNANAAGHTTQTALVAELRATQTALAAAMAQPSTARPSNTARPPTFSPAPSVTLLSPTATAAATPDPPTLTPAPTPGIGATQVYIDSMVGLYVPAGEFLMGSTDADKDRQPDEKPQHTVYLDAYWIDQTEVTNVMFTKFVAATNYRTDAENGESGYVFDVATGKWSDTKGANWLHPRGPSSNIDGQENHPVVQMSWNDAKAYCEWAGRQLPTEAQWEKAARGTDGRLYPWGNQAPSSTLANYNQNVKNTSAVGKYPAGTSPYGALDMAGNVWEWVADWYGDTYYAGSPDRNPTGPTSGQQRVLRGGAWINVASYVRTTSRFQNAPAGRVNGDGFRCAR